MKKVLMISYFFPPLGGSGVQRTLKFVKYLPTYGLQPIVSTVQSGHNFAYDESLLNEIPDTVQVYRSSSLETLWLRSLIEKFAHLRRSRGVPNIQTSVQESATTKGESEVPLPRVEIEVPCLDGEYEKTSKKTSKQKIFEFIDNYLFIPDSKVRWLPFGFLKSLRVARKERVDYLFSTSYPYTTHLIALWVHKFYRKPWIADFRDPWVGNKAMQKELPFRLKLDTWLESKVVQKADYLVNVTPSLTEMYKKRYPEQAQKMITITNGFDPDDFMGICPVIQEKFTLIHTGIITEAYDMATFVEGVDSFLKNQPEARELFQVLFIGFVPPKYEDLLRNTLKETVKILPYMSHKEVLNYQAGSHLLFLTFDQSVDVAYSGKIFDYIGVGKPILGLLPGGVAAQLIKERKLGTVVSLGQPLELADAVSQYFNSWREQEREGSRAGVQEGQVADTLGQSVETLKGMSSETQVGLDSETQEGLGSEIQVRLSSENEATATEKCADFNRLNLAGKLAGLMK